MELSKRELTFAEIKHQQGEKNSQFGTKWIHRGLENKKIKATELEQYLLLGWEAGRKIKELKPRERKKWNLMCTCCNSAFLSSSESRDKCTPCVRSAVGKIASQRGTHAGWHNRKGERSYPEKYFESVFVQENILGWIPDKKVGRWFIDFAFEDKKIAVEIDGRQHKDPERAASDKRKDDYLIGEGWKVFRVEWFNPKDQKGKDSLYPQIELLLESLRNLGLG